MDETTAIKLQGRSLHPQGMRRGELILETCVELEFGISASRKGTPVSRCLSTLVCPQDRIENRREMPSSVKGRGEVIQKNAQARGPILLMGSAESGDSWGDYSQKRH